MSLKNLTEGTYRRPRDPRVQSLQSRAKLIRPPMMMDTAKGHNLLFNLYRNRIRMPAWRSGMVDQTRNSMPPVSFHPLVSRLATDTKLPT
jgi:hypothetical protein